MYVTPLSLFIKLFFIKLCEKLTSGVFTGDFSLKFFSRKKQKEINVTSRLGSESEQDH